MTGKATATGPRATRRRPSPVRAAASPPRRSPGRHRSADPRCRRRLCRRHRDPRPRRTDRRRRLAQRLRHDRRRARHRRQRQRCRWVWSTASCRASTPAAPCPAPLGVGRHTIEPTGFDVAARHHDAADRPVRHRAAGAAPRRHLCDGTARWKPPSSMSARARWPRPAASGRSSTSRQDQPIPVGLANGFVDGLAARGTVSGKGNASGTLDNPTASFDLTGSGITADAIAKSGIEPLTWTRRQLCRRDADPLRGQGRRR